MAKWIENEHGCLLNLSTVQAIQIDEVSIMDEVKTRFRLVAFIAPQFDFESSYDICNSGSPERAEFIRKGIVKFINSSQKHFSVTQYVELFEFPEIFTPIIEKKNGKLINPKTPEMPDYMKTLWES